MHISDNSLDEFMAIYQDEFGEEIDRTHGMEMAHRLLAIAGLLARKPQSERRATTSATPQS